MTLALDCRVRYCSIHVVNYIYYVEVWCEIVELEDTLIVHGGCNCMIEVIQVLHSVRTDIITYITFVFNRFI